MLKNRRSLSTKPPKLALISFHKNVANYPEKWINDYRNSILNQTYKKFDIFEVNYGGTEERIFENSIFESKEFPNHAEAHNYLLDKVFSLGYDYAANTNLDDVYSLNRLEKQLPYMKRGYDIISSNFYNINEEGKIIHTHQFHNKNIRREADKEHNILCHPVICYSKHFWTTCTRLNPDEIPEDDFKLWKRSFGKYKFVILPYYLMSYRVHQSKICNQ